MNEPSSSLSPENQHFADTVQLWNQITNKHAVDALLKFMSEEAKTSAEDTKRFAAMWDNVPPENTITLNAEESKVFAEWLNNPQPPNERLIKFLTTPSVLEKLSADEQATKGMQRLWQHSENYLQQLRQEVHKQMGVPENLASDDVPPNV
jgi:uncharacterized protein (DUF1778 family)